MKTTKTDPSPTAPYRFGRALMALSHAFHRLGDENLSRHGISFSQLKVLSHAARCRKDGVLQRDLEKVLGTRRSSVTSLLQNMEKNGLIRRLESASDARQKRIFLTPAGAACDEELRRYIESLDDEMMAGFDDHEKELLKDFLARMAQNLEQAERKAL